MQLRHNPANLWEWLRYHVTLLHSAKTDDDKAREINRIMRITDTLERLGNMDKQKASKYELILQECCTYRVEQARLFGELNRIYCGAKNDSNGAIYDVV